MSLIALQRSKVDFIATDIYRIVGGTTIEDWHVEDNLTPFDR